MMVKVVDLFAGPGGLSEGFQSFSVGNRGKRPFTVVLSIEKDPVAYQTLRLRAFYDLFRDSTPCEYYDVLRGIRSVEDLFAAYPAEAERAVERTWLAELGPGGVANEIVRERVAKALGRSQPWVLIGGPPCQAYSLVGRARNRGNPTYDPTADKRQRLYVEYLQILSDHSPDVFLMENVKGLLSANLNEQALFNLIISDLKHPSRALARDGRRSLKRKSAEYRVFSLTDGSELHDENVASSVVRAELHGIPQARHRVILLGIRKDVFEGRSPGKLRAHPFIALDDVIDGLPQVRSGISRAVDSADGWAAVLRAQSDRRWANAGATRAGGAEVARLVRQVLNYIRTPDAGRGGEYLESGSVEPRYAADWYSDKHLDGVVNHSARAHVAKDLFRYLYASCFGHMHGHSPTLKEFPTDLLPEHANVGTAIENGGHFSDRFRVQVRGRPSTTVVSHISKDGHYYIHPDPWQCRSLTVREAARLQTFPDNYFFCGPRTAQYVQVGNAVPPLLARQIASIVYSVLEGNCD